MPSVESVDRVLWVNCSRALVCMGVVGGMPGIGVRWLRENARRRDRLGIWLGM